MKKIIKEYNIQTGEETIIERDETKEEKAERQAFEIELAKRLAEAEATKVEAEAKAVQRQAIADRLGLTAEELQVLLG